VDAAEKLGAALTESLRQAADDLAQVPEFTRLYDQLLDPDAGETGAQKSALVEYVARNDIALPQTKTGVPCTMKQAGKVEKVSGLPAWKLLHTIQTNKSGLRVVRQYQKAAANDGRVHSLITFEAATGRTVSTAPTVQNIPRDPRFRKLVQAKPGHLILAVDYSAIELVIAAALAERAVDDLRTRVKRGDEEGWFMGQVWAGCCATTRLTCPAEPEPKWTLEWLNEAIPATAQQVLRRKEQAMASIFRRKLDPHLVTAIDMARRTGKIDTGGLNSVEWLAAQDDQATKAIKVQLKQERQSAKPVNFGLLYGRSAIGLHGSGISDYGLTWTIQEATQARNAWFDLYPELRLWHFWTKYTQSRKVETNQCVLWDTYKRKLVRPQHKPYIYEPTTLAGRPFALLDRFKEARNYQDQGTGADILANAIAALPEDVAAMMLMPVHDELVFEAPGNAIEEVKRAVVETMIRAADTVLGGEIPIEVETAIGETWRKA
jgi:DNA polymerase-1